MPSGDRANDDVIDNLQSVAFTVARVGDSLARVVSASNESSMSRNPFRVSTYHAGLTYRFVESAEAVITVFKARQYTATITLTQSVIMTTAALWQLYLRVDSSIKRDDSRFLETYLQRIFSGEAGERLARTADADNVMRFIERADADYPMFRQSCEELFELDRPEWFGTGALYGDGERSGHSMEFRRRLSESDAPIALMSMVLKLTALAYEHYDRELARLLPRLVALDQRGAASDSLSGRFPGPGSHWIEVHRRFS